METSIPVVVATISQSLATFIQQELAETNTAVHLLTEPGLFFKRLKHIKPGIILLDANYPTGEKSAELARDLLQKAAWKDIPLVVIKTFFEPLDESFPQISQENILTQPFTRSDLLTILQQLVPETIDNQEQEQGQDIPMKDEAEKVEGTEAAADRPAGIIELTDIVEEGLPLDQLEPSDGEAAEPTEPVEEPPVEIPADSDDDELLFPGDEAIESLDFAPTETEETLNEEKLHGDQPAAGETSDSEGLETPREEIQEVEQPQINEAPEIEATNILEDIPDLEADMTPESPTEIFNTESPEDYLVPGEDELMESTEGESLPPPPAAAAKAGTETAEPTAQPSVITEPPTTDFSHQIEGLTQEWSKKMLVSTYASMDKLIQALGDMAPTIVEQVAREIIPPLAEKIIKSEIQRLEEKIEDNHT